MNSLHILNKQGDFPVTLVIIRPGRSKLQLVKSIKTFTGLGLKESKDIIDNSELNPQTIKLNTNSKDLAELKIALSFCENLNYTLSDIQDNRHKKLIELGLGTKEDFVELLIENDIYNLYNNNHEKIKDLLRKRYDLISEKNLKNLLNIN